MKVSAQYAEEHFADLMLVASEGEEVEIAVPDKPSLKLVVAGPKKLPSIPRRRALGAGRGELRVPSDEEWRAMDRELEQQMNGAGLITPDRS